MKKDFLAIFDLDGTLFDTSEVNFYSYKEALAPYNVQLDYNFFIKECNGRHYTEFIPKIIGTVEHIIEIHNLKKKQYKKNLYRARPNQHLFNIIKAIHNNYYISIVTTASKQNTNEILNYFGYHEFFDLIVSQEDISKPKPDPEGFNLAINYFNIDTNHTIIFEDSAVGIAAARATKAPVVIVDHF